MRRERDENWSDKGVRMRNLGCQHLESVEMGPLLNYKWLQIQIHFVKMNLLAFSGRLGLLTLLKWFHDDGNENYILNFAYLTGKNCSFCAPHTWFFQLNTFFWLFALKQRRKTIKLEVLRKKSAHAFSIFLSKFQILSCQSNFQEVDFYFRLGGTEQWFCVSNYATLKWLSSLLFLSCTSYKIWILPWRHWPLSQWQN